MSGLSPEWPAVKSQAAKAVWGREGAPDRAAVTAEALRHEGGSKGGSQGPSERREK